MKTRLKYISIYNDLIPYAVGAAVAVCLKYLYSQATSDDLIWILGPTSGLVSWLTGHSFVHDSLRGFVNPDLAIAIAPACSGVNFLIIAYIMSFFSFAHRSPGLLGKWVWMVITLSCSYVLTLFVNTIRICLSIASICHDVHFGWLTPERIHRIEGVMIYFFFLCLFYQGIQYLTARPPKHANQPANRFGLIWMGPLFWYITVALIVPIITGNYREQQGRFVEHGLMVLVSCICVLIVYSCVRRLLFSVMNRET